MRILRQIWERLLLPASLIGLSLSTLSIRAADQSNQILLEADDVDLAKVQAGGQIIFVSSGPRRASFQAIDGDRRTVFQFSVSDARPTAIVKLTEAKPVHRVSLVPGSQSRKVDIYLLNELPRNPSELDQTEPLTSIVDLVAGREASAEFAPQRARYLVLRWTMSDAVAVAFKVAEISAFTKGEPTSAPSAALAATDPPIYLVQGPPVITPPVIPPVSP
jgi:hypothetical protein